MHLGFSTLLLAVPVVLATAAAEPTAGCKTNAKLVGACYVIHGRATYGSGTPALRIWPLGTKRILGVTAGRIADDADEPLTPPELRFDPSMQAFGDFEVCPFTPEHKGQIQMVCVQAVTNLVVR